MRFARRSRHHEAGPYPLQPPYGEARAELLALRPAPQDAASGPVSGDLFAVVADIGLETHLVSVYMFAAGDVSIYTSEGIHSTGLRGAGRVAEAAGAIFEAAEEALGEFSRVDDLAALPLPDRGDSQILVRSRQGDFAASPRLGSKHEVVTELAAMALLVTRLARMALFEGFDRVEPGEVKYEFAPEYRRMRSTLMAWLPPEESLRPGCRVAGVTVEFGEPDAVISLFAFADGSTSVYRSDGSSTSRPRGVEAASASAALLAAVEQALPAFGPAELVSPPQPGQVQFVTQVRRGHEEWSEQCVRASRADLEKGGNSLAPAFDRAVVLLGLAGIHLG